MTHVRTPLRTVRATRRRLTLMVALAAGCAPSSCPVGNADGGVQCRLDRDCAANQSCREGTCVDKRVCTSDASCAVEERCDRLAGQCVLRNGFAHECGPHNGNLPCALGEFCALGKCRATSTATLCTRRFECPMGQVCDRMSFYCIEEASCALALDPDHPYPELACDPGETCDAAGGTCVGTGPPECDPTATPSGCAGDELCNGARRCVQCISSQDCGPGLRCNTRAGLCESQSTCRRDADCNAPLVCDRATAICTVPLPPCTSDYSCQLGYFCDRTVGTCAPREGKCDDDRFEPNESPPGARPLDLSQATVVVEELMLCPNNADVFSADLRRGDQLTARVSGTVASARAVVTALAADGLTTIRSVEAPPRGNGTVSFVAQVDGLHYVRVISPAGKSPYRLEAVRTVAEPCWPDALEPLSNTPWTAPPVEVGTHDLTLCPGDVDWVRVAGEDGTLASVRAGEALVVELAGPADADLDLFLTDESGSQVLASSSGPTSAEWLRYRAPVATALLVRVAPYGQGSGSYRLAVTREPAFTCFPDALETAAAPDAGVLADASAGSADAGALADASAGAADAGALADASAGAADAGALADASAGAADAGALADASAGAADAGAPSDGGGSGTPPPARAGNDTREGATVVPAGGGAWDLTLCPGDEDWFVVPALSHQRVLATATWLAGDPGVGLEAYHGVTLAGRAPGFSPAALSVRGGAEGTVHLRVSGSGAATPYHLAVQVERADVCAPDAREPDDTPDQAALAPSSAVLTLCGSNVDLFRLEVGAGKRVRASVDFSTADGDLDLALLMPDGVSLLALSDGVTSHEELDLVIPSDAPDGGRGAYFLQVYAGRSGTSARYVLTTLVTAP